MERRAEALLASLSTAAERYKRSVLIQASAALAPLDDAAGAAEEVSRAYLELEQALTASRAFLAQKD